MLCIQNDKEKIKNYLSDKNRDDAKIESMFAYVLINKMESLFFVFSDDIKSNINTCYNKNKFFEYACLGGNINIVKWFLETYNISNFPTCLNCAIRSNNPDLIFFLLDNGGDIYINNNGGEIMIDAITLENGKLAKKLVDKKIDIENVKITINKTIKDEYKSKYFNTLNFFRTNF